MVKAAEFGLETGFILDRQWYWMRTGMELTKKPALLAVGSVLAHAGTPYAVPVQFTDDPALAQAVGRADEIELDGVRLRVIGRADLLHEKLRAASDPARRRSKRLQDFADAQGLLETFPDLAAGLTAEERAALERLPT